MKKCLLLSLNLLFWFVGFTQKSSDSVSLIETLAEGNHVTDTVMHTTYDFQSNGQVANRMYHREDGSVAVVATMSHEYDQNASDRGTAYNFFDGNSWGDYPYERAEANATGGDMRTGWPSIAPYGENGEILVNHSDGLNYYIREKAGEGLWDGPYSIPTAEYSYSLTWPRVVTSGENNEIIHVVAAAQNMDNNGNTVTTQFYFRSTDGENWEVDYSPLVETNEHIGIYNADDYCVSANGDVVAVVYTDSFHGHLLMFKSTDNGMTWERNVIWENPYYLLDWETDENTIIGDEGCYAPVHSSVAVGNDGIVHVATSVFKYTRYSLGTTYNYWSGLSDEGVVYWNDTQNSIRSLDGNQNNALRLWWPDDENIYVYHSNDSVKFCGWIPSTVNNWYDDMVYKTSDYLNAGMYGGSAYPSISVDPSGNLAMAYSAPDVYRTNDDGYYYRSVFVSYKAAENEGWNVAVEELTEDFMFANTEALSVSAASVSAKENEFWFSFSGDDTHGLYFGSNASQSYATDNYVYVSKFVPGEYGGDLECDAPTDLTYYIDESDYNNVTLSWTAPAGADSANVTYEIYSTSTSMTPSYYGITETSFTIEDLSAGDYRYVIRANWNDECLSVPSNMVEFTITDCAPNDMIELTIIMSDTYYDGWNGGNIEIVGETNGSTYIVTLNSGNSDTITLSLCPDVYYFSWNNGLYDEEVGFEIFVRGNKVYNVAEGKIDDSLSNPFFVLRFEDIYVSITDITYDDICSSESKFNINVFNGSLQEVTSLTLEQYLDGELIGNFPFDVSIPSYESAVLYSVIDMPKGTYNIEFKIVEVNGEPFENSKNIEVVKDWKEACADGEYGEFVLDFYSSGYDYYEIQWEFIASDNSVIATGEFESSSTELISKTVTIPAGDCVRFVIRNNYGNSLYDCYYRIFDENGNVVAYHEGDFGSENNHAFSIVSDGDMGDSYAENTFNVNVDIPGTLSYKLLAMTDNMSDIYVLKVVGELNSDDLSAFSTLTNLATLDLTQTNVTSIRGCAGLWKLKNVYLPQSVNSIEDYAFYNCNSLTTVELPNVTTIGNNSFYNCNSLTTVELPNVTTIGNNSFYNCMRLSEVMLSDNLVSIPNNCFYYCNSLTEINLPSSLETIGQSAFGRCGLKNIYIPEGVTTIGSDAFNYCPLTTVSIPSTIKTISYGAFGYYYYNMIDVYCYAVSPIATDAFNGGISTATLHVPELSLDSYSLHESWHLFGNIIPIDQDISNIYINSDFIIVSNDGVSDDIDVTLDFNAHLTVMTDSVIKVDNYKQITTNSEYYSDITPSTMIAYSEINSDSVVVELYLRTDRWNFISFPFDVNVSDIKYPNGTLWVVRKYSGEDRANMTGNTWHNMTDDMTLNAGEGYILHCDHPNNNFVTFTFPAVDNDDKNNMFTHKDFAKELELYPSEYLHHSSWNLVGNPYPSYFNTNGNIEHNGIITVWGEIYDQWGYSNGTGYVAYSLIDDYYTLKPYESFFVQCPEDTNSMLFKKEGRTHTNDYGARSKRDKSFKERNSVNRKIYNITLNNEEYMDKTRLVINESASVDYEISCDASKFMNEDNNVPQIYVYDNEIRYAINERPLGYGIITLGVRVGIAGEYVLILGSNENYGQKVMLYDKVTSEEIDILNESYTFFAEEGCDDERFVLTITENTIGIDENTILDVTDSNVEIFDIYGRKVIKSDVKNGFYILKKGYSVQKVFINE